MHLGHASQTVGVLDARIVSEMRFSNLAALEKKQQVGSGILLTGMGARVL